MVWDEIPFFPYVDIQLYQHKLSHKSHLSTGFQRCIKNIWIYCDLFLNSLFIFIDTLFSSYTKALLIWIQWLCILLSVKALNTLTLLSIMLPSFLFLRSYQAFILLIFFCGQVICFWNISKENPVLISYWVLLGIILNSHITWRKLTFLYNYVFPWKKNTCIRFDLFWFYNKVCSF